MKLLDLINPFILCIVFDLLSVAGSVNPAEVAVHDSWAINVVGSENVFYFWDYTGLSINGVVDHTLQANLKWNSPDIDSPGPDTYLQVTPLGALPYLLANPVMSTAILSADVGDDKTFFVGAVLVEGGTVYLRTPPTLPLNNTVLREATFNVALRIVVI